MGGKQILFLGTHGQHNIGDELLLETFLSQLGHEHAYSINSYDPEFTFRELSDRYTVESFHTTGSKSGILSRILENDIVFFGGGSIIKELYASVGRNRYATLLMVLAIVTFAKQVARKPIIMSNIGVGPISTPLGRRLAYLILVQADLVAVRDRQSYETCRELGVSTHKLVQTPDAVFVNNPAFFGVERTTPVCSDDRLKIALNLNYNVANPDNWEHFLDNLAASLTELNQSRAVEIHAVPMQSQFNPDNDLKTLTEFRTRIPKLPFVVHEPRTANEVAHIVNECDVLLAERLHSLVIAAILHKPFVALAYDVKVWQLAEYLEMSEFAVDINRPFAHETIRNNVISVYDHRAALAEALGQKVDQASEIMRAYFAEVSAMVGTAGATG